MRENLSSYPFGCACRFPHLNTEAKDSKNIVSPSPQREVVRIGASVKIGRLESTDWLTIPQDLLDLRRSGITGTVDNWVSGYPGTIWWIRHDEKDGDGHAVITAYRTSEFKIIHPE